MQPLPPFSANMSHGPARSNSLASRHGLDDLTDSSL
jgi:hypothetical protein